MRFSHTQDQLDLRDGARDYLRGRFTVEILRDLRDNEQVKLQLWPELVELGLPGFFASEDYNGLAMDANGFVLIAEEVGYVALPEPLIDVASVCVPILNQLESDRAAQLCAQISLGEVRVRSVHDSNPYVNQLDSQDWLLALGEQIKIIEPRNYTQVVNESIDPLRLLSSVTFADDVSEVIAEGKLAISATEQAFNYGALFTAAELLGITARMIEMATDYAKEREQFGKPIGSYQAVKHHLATVFVGLEFARPVVYRAAADLVSQQPDAALSVSHAKVAASKAAIAAAETAIQVYGGMGYTFEADLHMWMKRAWALVGQWGDSHHHMRAIEAAVFGGERAIGPANTFNSKLTETQLI